MLILVLTRHGLTTRSTPEQHLGQTIDVPLSDDGRTQAAALADRLAAIAFDRIVSSPLLRAVQTAEAVMAAAATRPATGLETDSRLMEMDYGAWEGMTYEQIDARDAAERRRWEADPATEACPDGESGSDVAIRARSFLADLLTSGDGTQVLAVGHSTLNRVLICLALGIKLREFRTRIIQSQVNLTALEWPAGAPPEGARLLLSNDVAHVNRPPQLPWE